MYAGYFVVFRTFPIPTDKDTVPHDPWSKLKTTISVPNFRTRLSECLDTEENNVLKYYSGCEELRLGRRSVIEQQHGTTSASSGARPKYSRAQSETPQRMAPISEQYSTEFNTNNNSDSAAVDAQPKTRKAQSEIPRQAATSSEQSPSVEPSSWSTTNVAQPATREVKPVPPQQITETSEESRTTDGPNIGHHSAQISPQTEMPLDVDLVPSALENEGDLNQGYNNDDYGSDEDLHIHL